MYKIAPRINFLIQHCSICMVLLITYALNNLSLLFRIRIVHNHNYIIIKHYCLRDLYLYGDLADCVR
jgi:hypothetical protein